MAKTARSFHYEPRSKEDLKERANARGGNFDGILKPKYKMYKVRDGKNLIRVLPPTWPKARHYGYDIYVNYGIGADNQSYLSLSKMKNEKDPIAEARRVAENEGDEELVKALRPNQRILMWIIDRNDEDEGPQLWAAPFTVDKDMANISFDDETKEVVYIDDPENGCDVRFFKEGQGLKTKYDASKMRLLKPSPIHEDEKLQNEWLDYIQENPIPDCLQFYSYEHIAGVFNGQARKEKPEEDDERPRRGRSRDDDDEAPRSRKNPEPEDDEPAPRARRGKPVADEDDKPPFEDDEPKPRSRSRAKPEPEDEAEEEDEPKPRRRAAADDEVDAGDSIRDRLRRRRTASTPKSEDDD